MAMRILYLPVNKTYCILMDASAAGPLIDIDGKRTFESKKELREYLEPHGLGLKKGGWIVPLEELKGGKNNG